MLPQTTKARIRPRSISAHLLHSITTHILTASACLLLLDSGKQVHAADSHSVPNIVLIFVDDMGYGDIGPFGSTHNTPHLDRMAAEGMKLTDFYVSSSACTPSRAALMTGCYANRIGMGASVVFPADKRGLNPSEITIAEILKQGGYATGCFGKWHLGDHPSFMPNNQGFDVYEGIPYSNDMWGTTRKRKYPPLPWMKQNKAVAHIPDNASQAVLTDAITSATVDFIKSHKDEPFFAYMPYSAVHAPHTTTQKRLAAAVGDVMAALISEIDNSVGRVMKTVKELGIADNTLILFTNDNGGAGKTSSGPLRGAKFGPKYEGHMRVSTLAWWPGKIPAGSVSSEIMTTIDVLPTLAKLAGQPVPSDRIIDGKDVSDILLGKAGARSPHETLYYENDGVRQGKWKLVSYRVKADRFNELYDLDADLGEKNNIADKHPDRVKAMKALLEVHTESISNNMRPAAFVENPKPLLPDATGLPTLVEYLNKDKSGGPKSAAAPPASKPNNGLAPEVTDLNAEDVSYQLEQELPYLKKPYISVAPQDKNDGIPVGELGRDGGNKKLVLKFAQAIANAPRNPKTGNTDSLLISYKGKLVFESYYRRGRSNYPHYQMSITKSYTAMGVGRAIQLGHLTMADLNKPAISFLNDLNSDKLVEGADAITLHQAMHMSSGIRLSKEKVQLLRKTPGALKGQGQIQAYLQHSDPIPPAPRKFKYQGSDPALAMQVLEAKVPGSAKDFIRDQLLGPMGIINYHWQADTSGLPKSAAGSSFRSRDMLKIGMLVLDNGKWQGKQLIPADFVQRATSPIKLSYGKSFYGYFWWVEGFVVDGKTYQCKQGRGAGGQFIFMFPELELVAVVTAHNKGMGKMLHTLPQKLIPAFAGR